MAKAELTVVYRSENGGVVALSKVGFHALSAEGPQVGFSHSKTVAMRDLWAHEANPAPVGDVVAPGLDCALCDHASHDGHRCSGSSDDGQHACACSSPDPYNYATT